MITKDTPKKLFLLDAYALMTQPFELNRVFFGLGQEMTPTKTSKLFLYFSLP